MLDLCSIGNNFLATWLIMTAITLVTTLVSSSIIFKIYYMDVTFEKWCRKINPVYPTPEKVRDEIVLMVKANWLSTLCPTLSLYLSWYSQHHKDQQQPPLTQAYCTFSDQNIYSWHYHLGQFLLIVLVSDLYEWYYHRLGHTYKFFWKVHHHHHAFYNPSPFSVVSDETWDQFARALPLVLFPMAMPINMELMFFTYGMFFYFYGIYLHWGHELDFLSAHHPIFNTSYQHYVHHAKSVFGKPYHTGFFFKCWDQMAGSLYPDSKCDCLACQARNHGPRTREAFEQVVKPDYSVLWKDPQLWFGSSCAKEDPQSTSSIKKSE